MSMCMLQISNSVVVFDVSNYKYFFFADPLPILEQAVIQQQKVSKLQVKLVLILV